VQEKYCVVGGEIKNDLPGRSIIYPSYGYENGPSTGGTLLIYNWATDALLWTGMSDEDRVDRALTDI